jgi:hypothetical protein
MRLAGGALPVPALHASAHHDASPPSPQVAGGALPAGELPRDALPALYSLGLVRYDVPVAACDRIAVPPLKGFVMNRVGHDYLEKMLYEVIQPAGALRPKGVLHARAHHGAIPPLHRSSCPTTRP